MESLNDLLEKTEDYILPDKKLEYKINLKPALSKTIFLIESLDAIIDSHKYLYEEFLTYIDPERQKDFFNSYKSILLEQKRQLIDTLASSADLATKKDDNLEQVLRRRRNIATRAIRQFHLLYPVNQSDFEATLGWMIEQGDKNELVLIREVRHNPPFSSEQIQGWFNEAERRITERQIIKKLNLQRKKLGTKEAEISCLEFYRIYGIPENYNNFPAEAVLIETYPAFSIISASEDAISMLREKFTVEIMQLAIPSKLVSPVSMLEKMPMQIRDYIVRFIPSKRSIIKKQLEETGAKVLQPLGGTDYPDYVVEIPTQAVMDRVEDLPEFLWIRPYQPSIRVNLNRYPALSGQSGGQTALDASAEVAISDQDEPAVIPGAFYASFFTPQDRDQAEAVYRKEGIEIVERVGERDLIVNISGVVNPAQSFALMTKQAGLRYLEEELKVALLSNIACEVIGTKAKGIGTPILNLTGKGEVLAIADTGLDTGDVDTLHSDFRGRVKAIQPHRSGLPVKDERGHGTHVAGIAIGNGTHAISINLPVRGVAPEAELLFQSGVEFIDSLPNLETLFEAAYAQGARVHSNSWGVDPADSRFNSRCEHADKFVWNNKDFLAVFAAGNSARQYNHEGEITQKNICVPGTAKNCLTVGACENDRPDILIDYGTWNSAFCYQPINSHKMTDSADHIAAFSSRGPALVEHHLLGKLDRRKPDVVAPGTYILSTKSSLSPAPSPKDPIAPSGYVYESGTSMATPLVAGAALLIRQYLREQQQLLDPSAALIKAALIHSARHFPCHYPHPDSTPHADNEQGWGRIYLPNILCPPTPIQVLFIDEVRQLGEGESIEYLVVVEEGTSEFRATLVYTDPPHQDGALMNNLNLEVTDPKGAAYFGNDFAGTGKADDVNNVEGVIAFSIPGIWKIKVIAKIIEEAQDFALMLSASGLKLQATDLQSS